MNIVMITNTYLPHVGGVAHSVESFRQAYRERGHRVTVVAPEFEGVPKREEEVIRVPAIQKFNGSDFSVSLPVPWYVSSRLKQFEPDIIHSHHPFLLGDTALSLASSFEVPLVFTLHTRYEHYTHYVPAGFERFKRLAIQLYVGYCNLADHVIAPSESIRELLLRRGVRTAMTVIPTGIDVDRFSEGDRETARRRLGVPEDAFLVGHVGRLAPEKNLGFLAGAMAEFAAQCPEATCLVVGSGPMRSRIQSTFRERGLGNRLFMPGTLSGRNLVDAYNAFDVFAFASRTETQGMVLAEAMSASVPVVALNAPGAREVVEDQNNGRLVMEESIPSFADALHWFRNLDGERRQRVRETCRRTAGQYAEDTCAARALDLYERVIAEHPEPIDLEHSAWSNILKRLKDEWAKWSHRASAVETAFSESPQEEE